MSNYKLIKKYPSLPHNWKQGMLVGLGDRCVSFSPCDGRYSDFYLPYDEVTNNPEFWEEEGSLKNYKIISFFRDSSSPNYEGVTFTLNENTGLYDPSFKTSNLTEEHCLSGGFNIKSIKRLSDEEIFTIGDLNLSDSYSKAHPIQKFFIVNGNLFFDSYSEGISIEGSYHMPLEELKKVALITLDGVSLSKWGVGWVTNKVSLTEPYEEPVKNFLKLSKRNDNFLIFSSKETAEEYILFNKKDLSLNDVFEIYPKFKQKDVNTLTNHAKKLVELVLDKK